MPNKYVIEADEEAPFTVTFRAGKQAVSYSFRSMKLAQPFEDFLRRHMIPFEKKEEPMPDKPLKHQPSKQQKEQSDDQKTGIHNDAKNELNQKQEIEQPDNKENNEE